MKKLNLNLVSTNNPVNTKQQLIDSLTAHISLYHEKSPNSNSNSNPNPNHRSTIIRWFSSLSVHQRRAHLTTVDSRFIQILLQMLHKLHSNGHGFFFILPDIPSRDHLTCCTSSDASNDSTFIALPSLCFRKSQGLLARVSESNEWERVIYESTRLFSSKEGENVERGCKCCLGGVSCGACLDTMTVSKELVENVDRFVEVMDGISNGQFLRGEENGSGVSTEWVELEWLKEKGYYSMVAFVANRLEVALRLAWLNSNNGKKRGVKLKDKLNAAGVATNMFWRKKGCVDWWDKLDEETKRKVFRVLLGKAAKSLTAECLRGTRGRNDDMWMCSSGMDQFRCNGILSRHKSLAQVRERNMMMDWSMPSTSVCGNSLLDRMFHSLYIIQTITSLLLEHSAYNKEELFFSSLDSASTVSDCILRKLRDILMIVSYDYTKLELLQDEKLNFPPKKHKEKLGASKRKTKGKNHGMKKQNSGHRSLEEGLNLVSHAKDNECKPGGSNDVDFNHSSRLANEVQKNHHAAEIIQPAVEMGHGEGSNNGNVRGASRRGRKGRSKAKNTTYRESLHARSSPTRNMKDSSLCVNLQDGAANFMALENLPVENLAGSAGTGNHKLEPISSDSRPTRADKGSHIIQGRHDLSSPNCSTDPGYLSSGRELNTGIETATDNVDSGSASVTLPVEFNNDQNSIDSNHRGWKHPNKKDKLAGSLGTQTNVNERRSIGTYNVRAIDSPAYISYEWPSVAPYANSHTPAASDRLHLEVGHNWKNHLYQSFLQPMHHLRNPPVENGHCGIASRPLQMSLDWPPMVRGVNGMTPSVLCNYDSEFLSRRQSSFKQAFTAQAVQGSSVTAEDERVYSGDFMDFPDYTNAQEVTDEHENHWMSEEELEVQTVPGMDYNQYFGGGVMYWTPDDYPGPSFSRPPSLSSDDGSWAWREADINRAVDDMVAFSSSYSTNGLTSPSAASYCSPFDPMGPGHQALGYVISENEINGKVLHPSSVVSEIVAEENASGSFSSLPGDVETKAGDSLQCPILRPIIIPNMSRERSRSEFKRSHDHRSPCIPPNRREQPRIKRPPSPVVLCVPRAPRPPPPSPVGDSRKHRGFPTVRSGSSSPRHWGVKGWFHDGNYFDETSIPLDGSEVVWPSWRNKSLSARKLTQPVPGALLQDRLIAISQLARDQEHPDVAFPLQPPDIINCSTRKESLSWIHSLLHDEIDSFCKQVAAENMTRKPYINWAVKRVARSLQVLWPRSRTNIFGSNATGLSLPSSDVDLVVCLPPVRNLEPIKEAGILEGRNGIKETCLQHAARYLANQEWVKNDSLKIVENTAIPIIMLVVEVPHDLIASTATSVQASKRESIQATSELIKPNDIDGPASKSSASSKSSTKKNDNGKTVKSVRLDISFKSPSHTGLQTSELVKELTEQFPAAIPLALVLKQFLADRSLDQSYSGGLSSYCLVLLITRFLQHEHHHGRPVNQNYGSLLMDFFYFFGNLFDPRQMRISVQGSGLYIKRESGHSIDPLCIDDPLFPINNVGRNCFRIHQCIKAFADAYSTLESELESFVNNDETCTKPSCKLLPKVIASIGDLENS